MKFKIWFVAIALCLGVAGLRVLAPMPINAACLGNSGLLANGSFEDDKTSWRFYTDGAARLRIDSPGFDCTKTALVQIDQPGENTQLYQTKVTLEPATRYRLSFAAYSSNGNDLGLYLHEHSGDYTSYGLSIDQVDLSTAWQQFTFEFVTEGFSAPVADGRLRFWLSSHATAGERYWIDGIVLEQVPDSVATATSATSFDATATDTPTPEAPTPTAVPDTPTPTSLEPTATAPAAEPTTTTAPSTATPLPTIFVPTPTATNPSDGTPGVNPIVVENQQPGTTAWKLGRKANDSAGQIKGY
ncbi:MAG: carbohydrate binding domain-containing protein, partial [Caldilineaceae bacterium]|nr:carbohydrate binding domain-containing protein [Caldilineaceae bacterium]